VSVTAAPDCAANHAVEGDTDRAFCRVLDAWTRWRADRAVPDWSSFDVLALPAVILDRVGVVDVVGEDARDFRIRLAGETVQAFNCLRVRGLRLGDLVAQTPHESIFEHYAICVAERRPIRSRGSLFYRDREFIGLERLLLPFTKGGDTVARIFAVFDYDRPPN
jgi:hypothetical protein